MGSSIPHRHFGELKGSTGLLILGMHRSGTSALTRVLNLLGADLGPRLLQPGASNELGFWEHKVAYEQNDWLLTSLGRSWDDIRSLPPRWQESSEFACARARLIGVMAEDFATSKLWAVKDPRICRLLPLWQDVFDVLGSRIATIIAVRDPEEVAGSLMARDGLSFEHGCMLWARYMLDAERDSRSLPRCVVTYDSLLADWQGVASHIESCLDLKLTDRSRTCVKEIESFIDEGQRHHKIGKEERRTPGWVDTIYRDFLSAQTDASAWDRIRDAEATFQKACGALDAYTEKLVVSVGALEKVASKVDWQSSALGEFGEYCRQQFEARWHAEELIEERIRSHSSSLDHFRDFFREEMQANRERQEYLTAKVEWQSSAIVGFGDFIREQDQAESQARQRLAEKVQSQSDALASFGDHLRQVVESHRLAQEQLHGEIARLNALLAESAKRAEAEAAPLREQVQALKADLVQRETELANERAEHDASAKRDAEAVTSARTHAARMAQAVDELRREGSRVGSELADLRIRLEESVDARLHAERRAAGFLERIEALAAQLEESRRLDGERTAAGGQRTTSLFGRWKGKSAGSDNP